MPINGNLLVPSGPINRLQLRIGSRMARRAPGASGASHARAPSHRETCIRGPGARSHAIPLLPPMLSRVRRSHPPSITAKKRSKVGRLIRKLRQRTRDRKSNFHPYCPRTPCQPRSRIWSTIFPPGSRRHEADRRHGRSSSGRGFAPSLQRTCLKPRFRLPVDVGYDGDGRIANALHQILHCCAARNAPWRHPACTGNAR